MTTADAEQVVLATAPNWRSKEIFLPDRNFCWRSEFLRTFATILVETSRGLRTDVDGWRQGEKTTFLPIVCDLMHSGITATCAEECALHSVAMLRPEMPRPIAELLEGIAGTSPSDLSGGEHVALSLACSIAIGSRAFLVDGALEQLDRSRRLAAVRWLRSLDNLQWLVIVDGRDHWPNRIPDEDWLSISPMLASKYVEPAMPTDGRFGTVQTSGHRDWSPTRISLGEMSFAYPQGRKIFEKVDCVLSPGRIYHLSGENGSGKTTLAKLLCGAVLPTAGRVRFENDGASGRDRRPAGEISISFQNPDHSLTAATPVLEIVGRLKRGLRKKSTSELSASLDSQARYWLEMFGMGSLGRRATFDLPFAARQRVSVASAFAQPTPWLFLDEPTLGQDAHAKSALTRILEAETAAGRGCILISHDDEWASSVRCERISITGKKIGRAK